MVFSVFLSLPAFLKDFFPCMTSAAALSISARAVWPQVIFLLEFLNWHDGFSAMFYDVKNIT